MKKLVVGVMGSGTKSWAALAAPLGRAIAEEGYHLLTGGGFGTMTAVSEAFYKTKKRTGLAIGIIPTEADAEGRFNLRSGYPNEFVELPIIVPLGVYDEAKPDAITRNHANILTSDVIVALPGEKGTTNEIGLARRFSKPIILLGSEKDWRELGISFEITESIERVKEFLWDAQNKLS